MQGIYNMPETTHVSRVYSVAAILYLQFVLHVMLLHMLNLFCAFTLALLTECVLCVGGCVRACARARSAQYGYFL
jgi:hypothetical protein